MSLYRPTIGLEVHAELATATKMFCGCKNAPHEALPNTHVCPVCMAYPGTLPVPNKEAVRQVLRVGVAIGGTLAKFSEFDRKSYFYPDIPKGYQIRQYKHPFVTGGTLAGVAITRVHLEEDTARSSHDTASGTSLVDFNRAGVPLMELVTEPVIHDAETAGLFAKELQLLLRTLGASDANLEKGEMRIEANISVSATETPSVAYVEVKNINSFRSVERAIAYEISRQTALLESGGVLVKETRGWDEGKQQTFSQRIKEGASDYRYFPEPDIPKLMLSDMPEFALATLQESLPELPAQRRERYTGLGLSSAAAQFLSSSNERGVFFDEVLQYLEKQPESVLLAANYLISDVAGWYTKQGTEEYEGLSSNEFSGLVQLISQGLLSSRGAKDVLLLMLEGDGRSAETIARERGLIQVSDPEALRAVVQEVLAANEAAVQEYHGGKESSLQFLVGQSMKATKGSGNPATLKDLLVAELQK
ncbi:MAG: Asp-tRNA(Asn)/Glu-tRNA(Gln) amidotransferase subunit GatB [Patescibacteria group bacterium]